MQLAETGHDVLADLTALLRPVTAELKFARHQIRNYYDSWLAERRLPDGPVCFLHGLACALDAARTRAVEIDPVQDGDALALALAALGQKARIIEFVAAALSAGFFEPTRSAGTDESRFEGRGRTMRDLLDALGVEPSAEGLRAAHLQSHEGEFEAHDDTAIWIDPGHVLPAIILARRRLCRIAVRQRNLETKRWGTGFLIGPSAILTNSHVVEGVPSKLSSEKRIECYFDYSETTGLKNTESSSHFAAVENWCIAQSPTGLKEPDTAPERWWEDEQILTQWMDDVAGSLDYAVIRLASSPGLQRGWYDLSAHPNATRIHAIAFHHPGGGEQTVTFGPIPFSAPGDVRIFHRAGTTTGSSGSLVLNQSGVPVGLHHLGFDYQQRVPTPNNPGAVERQFMNVAVSLSHIASDLKAKDAAKAISESREVSVFRGCLDGRHPVFGRRDLMIALKTMWDSNDKRLLMVHLDPGDTAIRHPGKSFTIEIVKAIFRSSEHHHIVFRSGETEADALRMAGATIRTFAPDLESRLPAAPNTTTAAYVRTLVNFFGDAIRDRLQNKIVWLMIDDLDVHSLSDASGREFLATIYNQLERLPNLRIILIGLPPDVEISGVNLKSVIRSTITKADTTGSEKLFKDWLRERGARDVPIDEAAIDILAKIIASYAGETDPLFQMSDFVAKHLKSVTDTLFGKAETPAAKGSG